MNWWKSSSQVQPPCQPLHPALPPPGLYFSPTHSLPSSSVVLFLGEHLLQGLNCRHLTAGGGAWRKVCWSTFSLCCQLRFARPGIAAWPSVAWLVERVWKLHLSSSTTLTGSHFFSIYFLGNPFFLPSFLFAISLQQGVSRVLGLPGGGGGGPWEVGGGRGERAAAGGEAGVREGKRRTILQSCKQGQGAGLVCVKLFFFFSSVRSSIAPYI